MTLREQIEQEIHERGPMPFSRYMEMCLYHPGLGYYSRNVEQFGKAGDFYTASDLHAVFGRLLARQFDEMWRALDCPPQIELLELGPGRGLFARDVLDWSAKRFPDFFAALICTLQEASPALRGKLRDNLREHVESGKAAIPEAQTRLAASPAASDDEVPRGSIPQIQCTCPPAAPLIVFANEFFDALPVEILGTQGKLHLALEDGRVHEVWLPPAPEEIEFLDCYSVHPERGERIEVCLPAQQWMGEISKTISRGMAVVVDYGFTRDEQLAGHHRGTLMAYRQHSAHADPYHAPGEQDLTAHVNFSALAAAAEQGGLRVQKLLTQSQFLMGIGERNQFADALEDCRLPQDRGPQQTRIWPVGVEERAKVALQLKHLVTPAGMGETHHVLVASRGVGEEQMARLSGLSFGRGGKAA